MASSTRSTQTDNEQLAQRLLELTSSAVPSLPSQSAGAAPMREADAVITHIEVNDGHGVGALVGKLFRAYPNVLSIRSRDFYGGRQSFGDRHLRISYDDNMARDGVFSRVLENLGDSTVGRILCVPYYPDDARTAIALKEIFGAPLCTYLMDDQNLCTDGIQDELMDELLAKSSLRLAISPEMHAGYGLKYGHKMWYMPPVVSARLVLPHLNAANPAALAAREAVIVGNIWGQRWLELLRGIVRSSGLTLRWYTNGDFRWLPCEPRTLAKDGIVPHVGASLTDIELVEVLRSVAFVVVPSGTLDDTDDRRFIAQLSLPSRIPYILASSHAPILVIGDGRTAAARFVLENRIGMVAPYSREAFLAAIEEITRAEVNAAMRASAFSLARRLTDEGAAEWIWKSLAHGEAVDRRYEEMLPDRRAAVRHLVVSRARPLAGRERPTES